VLLILSTSILQCKVTQPTGHDPNLGLDANPSELQNNYMNLFVTNPTTMIHVLKAAFFVSVITCTDFVATSA
jgi:hypothetical protein